MKHLYYGQAQFLVGDDVADMLVEYAVHLAKRDEADSVTLTVLGPDGNEEESKFLITTATPLTVETTRSALEEPDNAEAIGYMWDRISAMSAQPVAGGIEDIRMTSVDDDDYL